jgi:hypothetical protein
MSYGYITPDSGAVDWVWNEYYGFLNVRLILWEVEKIYDQMLAGVYMSVGNLYSDCGVYAAQTRDAVENTFPLFWNNVGIYAAQTRDAVNDLVPLFWNEVGRYAEATREEISTRLVPAVYDSNDFLYEQLLVLDSLDEAMWTRIGAYAQGTQQEVAKTPVWLWGEVGQHTNRTWENIDLARKAITDTTMMYNQATTEAVNNEADRLYPEVGQHAQATNRSVSEGLTPQVGESNIWLGSIDAMVANGLDMIPDWIKQPVEEMATAVIEGMQSVTGWLWEQVVATWEWFEANLLPHLTYGATGIWNTVADVFSKYGQAGFNAILEHMASDAPITPEKAPALATDVLGMAMGFGLGAKAMSAAVEIVHPLKTLNLHTFSAFLAQMGNFGGIAAATMGVMTTAAVRKPYQYYANQLFRPTIPFDSRIEEMYIKEDISHALFRQGMSYYGYSEEWIDHIEDTMYREPSLIDLNRVAEDSPLGFEWYFNKLRRAQYSADDAEVLAKALVRRYGQQHKQGYMNNAMTGYKEGFIDDAGLDQVFEDLEIPDDIGELIKKSARLKEDIDYKTDAVKLFTDAYLKGELTTEEFQTDLTGLGIAQRRVDLIVARAEIRKQPKPTYPLYEPVSAEMNTLVRQTMTLLTTQFRKNLITADEYLYYLLSLGLNPSLADVLWATELAKKGIEVE